MRIDDDVYRAVREHGGGELVHHQLRRLEVQVSVNEAGDQDVPARRRQPADVRTADRDAGVEILRR